MCVVLDGWNTKNQILTQYINNYVYRYYLFHILGAIKKDADNKQVLDKLQVERERGITVKAQTASVTYKYKGQVSQGYLKTSQYYII